tara:strand:- start:178 stop:486 length:309 start_codon:yes stop_codon:yes gene_type:complete
LAGAGSQGLKLYVHHSTKSAERKDARWRMAQGDDGMTAERQFAVLVLLIVIGGAAAFFHLASAAPASLRFSQNGVPFYAHSVQHPESGKCLSTRELVQHFLN